MNTKQLQLLESALVGAFKQDGLAIPRITEALTVVRAEQAKLSTEGLDLFRHAYAVRLFNACVAIAAAQRSGAGAKA